MIEGESRGADDASQGIGVPNSWGSAVDTFSGIVNVGEVGWAHTGESVSVEDQSARADNTAKSVRVPNAGGIARNTLS